MGIFAGLDLFQISEGFLLQCYQDTGDHLLVDNRRAFEAIRNHVIYILDKYHVGEPGGGPFLAENPDGTVSLQVLESSQIDMSDPAKKAMFEQGTHFNPVDLVCAVKNYKGEKYNLPDYVDKNTGFISYKSKDGRELKALELPGLWNGAMSDWNTVFVEVPIETFNPVKTVNDLLRPEHQ